MTSNWFFFVNEFIILKLFSLLRKLMCFSESILTMVNKKQSTKKLEFLMVGRKKNYRNNQNFVCVC